MLWNIIKELLEEEILIGFPKQNDDKYSWVRKKAGLWILTEDIMQEIFPSWKFLLKNLYN